MIINLKAQGFHCLRLIIITKVHVKTPVIKKYYKQKINFSKLQKLNIKILLN